MLKFFKTWTLPISMLAGAIGYFVFANVTFLEPTKQRCIRDRCKDITIRSNPDYYP